MKRTLLIFSTFIVATMGFVDIIGEIATDLNTTREKVEACFIETNVTIVDLIYLGINNNENFTAMGSKESALKVGCLMTCLLQRNQLMTDTHINIQQMKEMTRSKQERIQPEIEPDRLKLIYEMMDTCYNLGRNITNECEVSLQFLLCFVNNSNRF